ncbi:MAG: Ribose-phosphate diphosphokinase, partial [Acidimicrobiales bacterium]|nr:Ribose-phosphate diphosphokinase [Acidimicrobiales bacterium]
MKTLVTKKTLLLYSGDSHPALAQEIATNLDVELGEPNLRQFANGELHCRYGESIRGADVFIVQTHAGPKVNDAIMQQLIMIDAAKRASAKRITAVCPYYGYARQDRKAEGREPITAKLVADMLTAAGADRMVSVDLHTGQIQGFFDQPVDHLTAVPILVDYLRSTGDIENLVIVAPDAGAVKAANRFAGQVGADLAFVNKIRPKGEANTVVAANVVGNVRGKRCVLLDDMIDTAGTIVAAADLLKAEGATEVWAMATHGVMSDPATERLKNSVIERVVLTNTLPFPPEKQIDKLEVLSIAGIIADAIKAVFEDESVSEIFGGEN